MKNSRQYVKKVWTRINELEKEGGLHMAPHLKQRETEYTHKLGKRIVEEFHKINRVFSSHLVAFTAFQIIRLDNKKLDLFNLLRWGPICKPPSFSSSLILVQTF